MTAFDKAWNLVKEEDESAIKEGLEENLIDGVTDTKEEIEMVESVIAGLASTIREAKADYAKWVAYKQRLEGVRLPQPTRKIRERQDTGEYD